MNSEQFQIWKIQKEKEYEVELNNLQDSFARRGLTFSGMRIKAGKYLVICSFEKNNTDSENNQIENKLLLMKKGDLISFSGIFTGGSFNGQGWYVNNCK